MSEDKKKKQESLYSEDLFNEEMKMINDELNDLDNLYNEIKTHFDVIKNSQARGSLVFIKDQTNNLISIKNAKLSYIKQKADLKKNITDFAFKEKNISNKENESVDTITAEIYRKITNDFKFVPDKHELNSDIDIDKILDEELEDINIENIVDNITSVEDTKVEYNTNEEIIEDNILSEELEETNDENNEEDNSMIVVDIDTNIFYKVNKTNLELIDELGYIEKIVDITKIDEDDYAVGESGTIYLTVTMEDDEE